MHSVESGRTSMSFVTIAFTEATRGHSSSFQVVSADGVEERLLTPHQCLFKRTLLTLGNTSPFKILKRHPWNFPVHV